MVILLDLSQSMMATDLQPNRLERAKFKINDLLKKDPKARAALIGFAGTAHTIVPLTKDYDIILSSTDGLKPSVMPFPGSNLEAALPLADTLMSKTKAPGTVIILSDDFEDSHLSLLQNFTENSGNKIFIIPMNTKQGSTVPAISGNGIMKDENGHQVYSSLDEVVISKLASLENVTVQPMTLDDSDVDLISRNISRNLIFKTKPGEKDDEWHDTGLLLVIPMILLLLLWFRKGWVVYMIPLFMMTSCTEISDFADLWFTKNYQGQRLMNKGDYSEAAEKFTDPMHKGVAFFKAGKFEDAIEAFKQDTTAQGAYNLGLAYFNNGDTAAALLAFGYAVKMDPGMEPAIAARQQLGQLKAGTSEVKPEDAKEAQPKQTAKNTENKGMEDLSGGGQEATKKDMEKQRKEESVATDIRKGKELEEVPKDVGARSLQQDNSKILMRKVDDDPALFLKRKFEYQVKKGNIKLKSDGKKW
jgi:Ca-activated chloride channel family protein